MYRCAALGGRRPHVSRVAVSQLPNKEGAERTEARDAPSPPVTGGAMLRSTFDWKTWAWDPAVNSRVIEREAVWTWGDDSYGQGGVTPNSRTLWSRPAPVNLSQANVSGVALGWGHSLAVTSRGRVYAWGANDYAQLGGGARFPGAMERLSTARPVPISRPVVAVAAGAHHSVALCADGAVYAWGDNAWGQVGTGEPAFADGLLTAAAARSRHQRHVPARIVTNPARVSGLTLGAGARLVACHDRTFAIDPSGAAYGWGDNTAGVLGVDSSDRVVTSPQPLNWTSPISHIACGWEHTLLLETNGTVRAWGKPSHTDDAPAEPIPIWRSLEPLSSNASECNGTASMIAAGFSHSLARCDAAPEALVAWGKNSHGQLGVGDAMDRRDPTTVLRLPAVNLSSIAAGRFHSLAAFSDGEILAWGSNAWGQLGVGARELDRLAPGRVLTDGAGASPSTPGSLAVDDVGRPGVVYAGWDTSATIGLARFSIPHPPTAAVVRKPIATIDWAKVPPPPPPAPWVASEAPDADAAAGFTVDLPPPPPASPPAPSPPCAPGQAPALSPPPGTAVGRAAEAIVDAMNSAEEAIPDPPADPWPSDGPEEASASPGSAAPPVTAARATASGRAAKAATLVADGSRHVVSLGEAAPLPRPDGSQFSTWFAMLMLMMRAEGG